MSCNSTIPLDSIPHRLLWLVQLSFWSKLLLQLLTFIVIPGTKIFNKQNACIVLENCGQRFSHFTGLIELFCLQDDQCLHYKDCYFDSTLVIGDPHYISPATIWRKNHLLMMNFHNSAKNVESNASIFVCVDRSTSVVLIWRTFCFLTQIFRHNVINYWSWNLGKFQTKFWNRKLPILTDFLIQFFHQIECYYTWSMLYYVYKKIKFPKNYRLNLFM